MSVARFVHGPIAPEVELALRRIAEAPDVAHVAVMPDVHLADEVCVGTVVATRRLIYPAAVGGDLGCGMAALRFEARASEALGDADAAGRLLAALCDAVPRHRRRAAHLPAWPEGLDPGELGAPALAALARHDGRAQLGTLGSGNHFVELQGDDGDGLWLMVHSGSRGLGPAIRDHHLRGAVPAAGLAALEAESPAGRAYLADLAWALRYADANRRLIVDAVAGAVAATLGAPADRASTLSCQHNHVRREEHDGEPLWVHRKGAISAAAGEPGIIPGSMGAASFHVEGRGHAPALRSSSHGAGRAMSRGEARRRISVRDIERQLSGVWFDRRRADALRDEAPAAYKNIGEVMRAQHELTRVVRRLRPLLCFKGS